MYLNHPETIAPPPAPAPWSVEKLSSTKPVPGAKKVGDCWCGVCIWCVCVCVYLGSVCVCSNRF